MENKNKKYTKDLKDKLTHIQYDVTQNCGTEPPFLNEYWDNKKEGIYVDIITGKPLFSSIHKYDSGTGWPSFFETINEKGLTEHVDVSHGMIRTEVKGKESKSHLGHKFVDPSSPTGVDYCINSAALRFIPKEKLSGEGYAEYLRLFEN